MKSILKKRLAFVVVLAIHFATAWSQETLPTFVITTDTTLEYIFSTAQYEVLPDKTGKLSFDEVKGTYSKKFFTKDKTSAGVDTVVKTTWYRYSVKNSLQKAFSVSLFTRSEHSDFFVIHNNQKPIHYKNGWELPWKDKDGLVDDNLIPLTLASGEQVVIYNRVNNRRPGIQYNFNVKLLNTNQYAVKALNERQGYFDTVYLMYGMFSGFCLLGALFNFFLFIIDRQKVHLYFSLFLLNMAFIIGPTWFVGVVRYYPSAYIVLLLLNGIAFALCFIQFTRYYFQTFVLTPKWDKLLIGLMVAQSASLLTLLNILPYSAQNLIMDGTIVISGIGTLTIFLRLRHKNARSFAIAILPFPIVLIGMRLVDFLATDGILIPKIVTSIVQVAAILSIGWPVLFFTWVLFKHYDWQKREIIQHALDTERLQKEKEIERNTLIEQQKVELEKTVHERTAELRQSIKDLQATQQQLIQSEKMASLGELTAGIAHEIQNPLNFVNNFSEVSKELLAEMKDELDKGNSEDAKEIANDVIQNLEKINHHGKRADAIVKGMLQHSRSSSGVKEPTDINALCDEYLRLSYHGLRAKDKSFNATMKTDFDASLQKVNIIPQDIGRVVLNLLTNAFYAVDEKKKTPQPPEGGVYDPTVSISTKKLGDKVEIRVSDNGNGIPQKVLDKIFQPFFTTKPTGQGTGLGLSLSYDIVKAHGGDLKVETKERQGTTFIIQLFQN